MQVVIIEYSDLPAKSRFMEDETGKRLIFNSHHEADIYLMRHAEGGVYYKQYDGED